MSAYSCTPNIVSSDTVEALSYHRLPYSAAAVPDRPIDPPFPLEELKKEDEAFSLESSEPSLWTTAAKGLMLSISLFVLVTTSVVVAIMVLQWTAYSALGLHIKDADMFANWLLQPQTIIIECVLLGVAYHSVTTRNMVLVIATLFLNLYLVVSGVLELVQRQHDLNSFRDYNGNQIQQLVIVNRLLWVLPFVDVFFHLGCDWAAYRLYHELGWLAYKTLGTADRALGRLYHRRLIARAVSMMTALFSLLELYTLLVCAHVAYASAVIKYAPHIPPQRRKIAAVTISAVVAAVCWTLSLWPLAVAVASESKSLARVALGLQTLGLACHAVPLVILFQTFGFVTKTVEEAFSKNSSPLTTAGNQAAESGQWKIEFRFIVTTLLMLLTLVYTSLVIAGFDRGLKDHLRGRTLTRRLDMSG